MIGWAIGDSSAGDLNRFVAIQQGEEDGVHKSESFSGPRPLSSPQLRHCGQSRHDTRDAREARGQLLAEARGIEWVQPGLPDGSEPRLRRPDQSAHAGQGFVSRRLVDEQFRNQGIGSLALYEIEDYCRERGMRAFQLQLPMRNKSAAIFYRKAGFRELARRVMILEVRPEEVVQARRASASKRR